MDDIFDFIFRVVEGGIIVSIMVLLLLLLWA